MKGYFYIILSLFFFSTSSIFVRIVDLPVMSLLFARYFFTFLFLLIFIILKKKKVYIENFKNTQLILAGIAYSLSSITFFFTLRETTIAVANILFNTSPIFIFLISLIFLREKLDVRSIISLVVSFIGILLVLDQDVQSISGSYFVFLIGLGTAILFAVGTILSKGLKHVTTTILTLSNVVIGIVLFLPFIFTDINQFTYENILLTSVLGLFTFIGFMLFYESLKSLPAHHVGIMTYLELVFAVILAFLFFYEIPTVVTLIGGLCIIVGTSMLILKPRSA